MIEARPVSEPVSKPTEPVVSIADELGKFAKLKGATSYNRRIFPTESQPNEGYAIAIFLYERRRGT